MGIPWLAGARWAEWTREERYFCAVLFKHADDDPERFAKWVVKTAGLPKALLDTERWEVGYEVCLYRDILWERDELARLGRKYPLKRTFDLCLFSAGAMIIIEAKAFEGFSTEQNAEFSRDCKRAQELIGDGIQVHLVALASSKYIGSLHRRPKTLEPFGKHLLTWAAAAREYPDERLHFADAQYGRKRRRLVARPG